MVNLGAIDLEILLLGINKKGNFNENDIEDSELRRLGVGRILDALASLKDRKLIGLNKDGSFEITDLAKNHLWESNTPLSVRILRLLEIKPYSVDEISRILNKDFASIEKGLEGLRKREFVLMSPIRKKEKIIPMFEILPEGKDHLQKIQKEGFSENDTRTKIQKITKLINEIKEDIQEQENISAHVKKEISAKLDQIKDGIEL